MVNRIAVTMCMCAGLLNGAMADESKPKTRKMPVGERSVYKEVNGRELGIYSVKPADWKSGDSRPAIVFFHGGGWTKGGPHQFNEHSKYLASRGVVCFQVEYRLIDKKAKETPQKCIYDAKSAMRWVRSKAAELGIDPSRIASAGGSAGGHLAAFVGMVDGMDDPQDDLAVSAKSNAMLLFNPVFDNGPKGFGYSLIKDRYRQYSPFHNISKDDPPAIVFLGDKDQLIPVETAGSFKKQMNAVGVACEVMIFEGMPHSFFNYSKYDHVPYYKSVVACDEFLAGLGWIKGKPTLSIGEDTLNRIPSYMIKGTYGEQKPMKRPSKGAIKESTMSSNEKKAFEQAGGGEWQEVFSDACTGDWKEQWFLDGEVGTVVTGPDGMTLTAGPEFRNDAHHMVLWTKESFEGDLKIEYDYTRLDNENRCVTILYIQATGSGEAPYAKDISAWRDLRKVPAMRTYFNNMNTYHISYAAFGNDGKATQSYIRARRYMPHKTGLKGSDLAPDYFSETLFAPGVKHHITVIKKARDLYLRIENSDEVVYCHMTNPELPPVTEGRIGLRHMFTRSAIYRNVRVSTPSQGAAGESQSKVD